MRCPAQVTVPDAAGRLDGKRGVTVQFVTVQSYLWVLHLLRLSKCEYVGARD